MIEEKSDKMKPFRILVFCPYESQVDELWNTFVQLIGDSPLLMEQVIKVRTSDVHLIEFKGQGDSPGSTIEGYTIGISSSNQGTSLRGLSADMIFIDEMDHIPGEIIEQVIFPITTTHHDVRLRVCSTPSGKREQFYKWATTAKEIGWYHSHVQSWHPDNDNWLSIEKAKEKGIPISDSSEFQVKNSTSSSIFEREYGAEFGEEFGGVFKHHFINRCLFKYGRAINVSDPDLFDPGFMQHPEHKYILGVDWNSYLNGGQVVLVEYCTTPTAVTYYDDVKKQDVSVDFTGKYRLFYRRGIKSKEATQRLTRQEIIRLASHFRIDYIYVDYGAGDTNIEELTLFGRSNPHLNLSQKLVVVDSGAVVEHYDHILRQTVKKRNKTLMVNFSVISLEEGMMILPKEEDSQSRLVGQMRSYLVKGITTRGEYAYEGPDHILDAFNLAIYGFQQKFGQLLNSRVSYPIMSFPDPRAYAYPKRPTFANSPVPIKFGKMGNTYNTPIRDPEKPQSVRKPHRGFIPSTGRSLDRGLSNGRQAF
jgi:replicative DNA helicase